MFNMTDYLWPVGARYECYDPQGTYPDVLFGGTWQQSGTIIVNGHTIDIWYRTA